MGTCSFKGNGVGGVVDVGEVKSSLEGSRAAAVRDLKKPSDCHYFSFSLSRRSHDWSHILLVLMNHEI